MNKCHRRCTRKGITKKEYLKRIQKDEKFFQAYCSGCHKYVIADINAIQYYDIDGILSDDS